MPGNDWLISARFALQAGTTYAIRFNYGGCGEPYTEKLAVHIGTAQTVATMTTQVFNNSSIN